jgi:hypothetical protein
LSQSYQNGQGRIKNKKEKFEFALEEKASLILRVKIAEQDKTPLTEMLYKM